MALVRRFGPPVALMALTFALSAQPDLTSGLDSDLELRKVAHMVEFGALWLLWVRALPGVRGPWLALAITLAYAASDEVHQGFVEGRHASAWDWAIDAAGVGLAAGIWALVVRRGGRAAPRASRARWP